MRTYIFLIFSEVIIDKMKNNWGRYPNDSSFRVDKSDGTHIFLHYS